MNIGWFSTGRGPGSRQLLEVVYNYIQSGDIDGKITFVFCNRSLHESTETDIFFDQVHNYNIPLITFSSQKFKDAISVSSNPPQTIEQRRITFDRDQNIPTSLNNPGCVRPGNPKIDKLAIGVVDTDSGPFLAFMNPRQGLKALKLVIEQYKGYTLDRFINRYAPPKENNTNAYLDHLCKSLNCSPKTLVKDVNQIELCKAISKKEGFKQTKLY